MIKLTTAQEEAMIEIHDRMKGTGECVIWTAVGVGFIRNTTIEALVKKGVIMAKSHRLNKYRGHMISAWIVSLVSEEASDE